VVTQAFLEVTVCHHFPAAYCQLGKLQMAFFFMKLPAKIRRQIYWNLLQDDEARVYVMNRPTNGLGSPQQDDLITTRSPEQDTTFDTKETLICLSDEEIPFQFFPEILSTSRQVYNEAVNILYGENVFCYALSESQFGIEVNFCRKPDFPRHALQGIRWLRMSIEEREDKDGKFETEILDGMGQFRSPECSLLGFSLDLGFFSHLFPWCGNQPSLSQFVLQDTRFMSALLAFNDLKQIQIYVSDDTFGPISHYSDWIQSIMTKKDWHCTTVNPHSKTWDLVATGKQSSVSTQVPSL